MLMILLLSILFFSFAVIKRAWVFNPDDRPSFSELLPELENLQESSHYLVESLLFLM